MKLIETPAPIDMPDIAAQERPRVAGQLDWVGMGHIEVPVTVHNPDGRLITTPARVDAFVNLKPEDKRGIHMSRLYLHVDRALGAEALTPKSLHQLLKDFLESHRDLSDRARVRIAFDYMVRRPALKSDKSGWRGYPVAITASLNATEFVLQLETSVVYSSTCPCSAALARQLIQQQFAKDFAADGDLPFEQVMQWLGSEQGIVATPHSQRSSMDIKVKLSPSFAHFPIIDMVELIEDALQTPVQTAVKREDEQAFALLNGQNLMFCEDAGRRAQAALNADPRVLDFWAKATHFESLHPHDAVAIVTKGVVGGFSS
jgi:GTP cyclohydrolase IB